MLTRLWKKRLATRKRLPWRWKRFRQNASALQVCAQSLAGFTAHASGSLWRLELFLLHALALLRTCNQVPPRAETRV